MWESKFENSSEHYSLNSKALSLSPKLSSVTDSKEETVYETDRLTSDSEQPKGHSPTGSMDMSASPQPLSTTVDLLHFETLRWPTQVIDDHEELLANESSSTESPFAFSGTTNSNSTDDTEDENEEESTAPSSMSSAYNDFASNATDVTETKPEVNSSTPTALDNVTGVHSVRPPTEFYLITPSSRMQDSSC
ncbi:putative protein TPRXL [Dermacentor silvarum]|uniref:putative protein TPRXL n=1 Tax=Dermacentor silvarum TaxID=543639 RepID=UPI0021014879|nr:putative protein TPRXL [Dermacentor silvarum]